MGTDDWKSEFQKVNAQGAKPSPAKAPSAPAERPKLPKFGIYDATVKLYRRGMTSIFGLAKMDVSGTVAELSEEGAEIVVEEQLLPDTRIHIRMEVAKFNDRIETDAVVRLCRKDQKGAERFMVRIDFSNPDATMTRKIAAMRGYFTSPEGQANLTRRLREEQKNKGLFE